MGRGMRTWTWVAAAVMLAAVAAAQWEHTGRSVRNEMVKVTLALPVYNAEKFLEELETIADPSSGRYAQWLTREEVLAKTAPPREVSAAVAAWVHEKGGGCASAVEDRVDAVVVRGPAWCIERVVGVEVREYRHAKTGGRVLRRHFDGRAYDVHPAVDMVMGLEAFPAVRTAKQRNERVAAIAETLMGASADTYNFIYPAALRRIYNIPTGTKSKDSRNSQSVIEFEPEGAPLLTDLYTFFQQVNEPLTNISHIVGPWSSYGDTGESTLDIEYLAAIGAGADTWYITIQGWIYEMANELFHMTNPPLVNSISYGWMELDTCQTSVTNANCTGVSTEGYVKRANIELAKASSLGVSIIACSQDEGAPSDNNEDCSLDATQPVWSIYPGASPYATTVSATTLVDRASAKTKRPQAALPPICSQGYTCDTAGDYEVPCSVGNTYYSWTTGGGFSSYAPRPKYQDAAVQAFLTNSSRYPDPKFFNMTGRGYSDVATVGSRYLIIQGGSVAVTAGTSASTPVFAAIVTLLNDARLQAGKKPLGFLNPMLYQAAAANPSGFRAVTEGGNKCSIDVCCCCGYENWNGWSPASGLGTPNFAALRTYVLSLP